MCRIKWKPSIIYEEYKQEAIKNGLKLKSYHSFYNLYFIRNKTMDYILTNKIYKTPAEKREYHRLQMQKYRKIKREKQLQEARKYEWLGIKTIKKSIEMTKRILKVKKV